MVVSSLVKIDGNEYIKWYDNENKKIRCVQDDNIYPSAYTQKGSTYTFVSTNIPLNEISSFSQIEASNVVGLSDYIVETIDNMDGVDDDTVAIDLGGATQG
jgi:hypothetical protein